MPFGDLYDSELVPMPTRKPLRISGNWNQLDGYDLQFINSFLVGGFNPLETYSSKWQSFPRFGVNIKIVETTDLVLYIYIYISDVWIPWI